MGRATESVAYVTEAFRMQDASPPTEAETRSIQSRWVRWTYAENSSTSQGIKPERKVPLWTRRPTVQDAWELLIEYMEQEILPVQKVLDVRHLAEGHFNTLFHVRHDPKSFAGSGRKTLPENFVMRLKLPWCPYYGVENEAATLVFAEEQIIPVTKVFCFDSSTKNRLGLNSMFMELIDVAENNWEEASQYLKRFEWDEFPRRLEPIARQVQEYMHRLAEHGGTFDGIGSLYASFKTGQRAEPVKLDFFLGPLLHFNLWEPTSGTKPPQHSRGPFKDCFDYLDALVDAPDFRIGHQDLKALERLPFNRLPAMAKRHYIAKELVAAARSRHEHDEESRRAVGKHTFEARLVHNDLHWDNIMVDVETGRVTMLLDWESADTRPAALTCGELKCIEALREHPYWDTLLEGNEVQSKEVGLRYGWGPRDLGCYDDGTLASLTFFVGVFAPNFSTWNQENMKRVARQISNLVGRRYHYYLEHCVEDAIQDMLSGCDPFGPVASKVGIRR